jgi:hypothetical protein
LALATLLTVAGRHPIRGVPLSLFPTSQRKTFVLGSPSRRVRSTAASLFQSCLTPPQPLCHLLIQWLRVIMLSPVSPLSG